MSKGKRPGITRSADFETREADGNLYIDGYFAVFNSEYWVRDDAFETIDPGAFSLETDTDVRALTNHDTTLVLGRTTAGTLQLRVDEKGLWTRTNLGLTEKARDMLEDIKVRNYTQMSFSFTVDEDDYDEATHTRIIRAFRKLYDISAVAFPANPGTDIGLSARDYFNGVIEREKAERLEAERRAKAIAAIKLKIKISGGNNGN